MRKVKEKMDKTEREKKKRKSFKGSEQRQKMREKEKEETRLMKRKGRLSELQERYPETAELGTEVDFKKKIFYFNIFLNKLKKVILHRNDQS